MILSTRFDKDKKTVYLVFPVTGWDTEGVTVGLPLPLLLIAGTSVGTDAVGRAASGALKQVENALSTSSRLLQFASIVSRALRRSGQ